MKQIGKKVKRIPGVKEPIEDPEKRVIPIKKEDPIELPLREPVPVELPKKENGWQSSRS